MVNRLQRRSRFLMFLDMSDYADPRCPVKNWIIFRFFMIVFHDSPADTDPPKIEKRGEKIRSIMTPL